MKKYFASGTTFAAILMCSSSAFAAQPGAYLGGGVGLYGLDIDEREYEDSAPLLRGFAGYRLHDNWAIEADYQRFTKAEDDFLGTDVEIDFEGYGIALRPMLPLSDRVDIYGRIGWIWYDGEVDSSCADGDACPAVVASVTGSGDDFTWGGGADAHLGDLLTLRGDVSRIEIENTDLNLVSVAMLLRF